MSRARHKKSGGKVDSEENPKVAYAGVDSNVRKEADDDREGGEMKKGGKVAKRAHGGKVEHKVEGEKAMRRLDRPERKRGGKVMHKASGGSTGDGYCTNESGENSFTEKPETPKRASGGRVAGSGSDMNPLSSASRYD